MRFLYSLGIFFLYQISKIFALFNPKIRLWVKAQKNIGYSKNSNPKNVAWFHVASYGEFEQAEPVIAQYKKTFPNEFILLSFFSPSGKEKHQHYKNADKVIYIPIDTVKNVRDFLNYYNPKVAIFVKYEYWFNFLIELKKRNITTLFFSCNFNESQYYFKKYGKWFLKHLQKIDMFLVQNTKSLKLAQKYNLTAELAGDTRIDKVILNSEEEKKIPLIKDFCEKKPTLILGSMWESDWEIWNPILKNIKDYQIILAPHEVNVHQIEKFNSIQWQFFSNTNHPINHPYLLIDSIGILKYIYQYATLVYIGGGFGKGIHNILEASVFGKGVVFGPKYQKAQEAIDLIHLNCAFKVENSKDLEKVILGHEKYKLDIQKELNIYFQQNKGATQKVINALKLLKKNDSKL